MSEERTTEHVADQLRSIANELFEGECANRGERCLKAEEDRPLTREEKQRGWTRRPFDAYDHNRMCSRCRLYWLAEMAAQAAHERRCWDRRIAAEEAMKGK